MRDRLLKLAGEAEVAIASATGVIDESELTPLREVVRTLRMRLAYPEDLLVVVLAGGTGSGKSSMFNAIIGDEVAEVGGVRPTTDAALASVPQQHLESMSGFLDHLEIDARHTHDGSFCLVDLPDYDSVETDHRETVERLLPLVDVVVWVADPEKYRDARLHHEFLEPLSGYQSQFVFALNQIDRLGQSEVGTVVADLSVALTEDGIEEAVIIPTAARPAVGPPLGVEALVEELTSMQATDAGLKKLELDINSVASSLSTRLGSGLDFDQRAAEVVDLTAADIVKRATPKASSRLVKFLETTATSAGGPVGEAIRRVAADTPRHVARIADMSTPTPERGLFGKVKEMPPPSNTYVASLLNSDIIRPARAHLAKRGLAVAAIAEFVVGTHDVSGTSGH